MRGYVTGATPLTPESLLAILQEGSPSPALICPDDDTVVSHGGLASAVHQLAGQRGAHGAAPPVSCHPLPRQTAGPFGVM